MNANNTFAEVWESNIGTLVFATAEVDLGSKDWTAYTGSSLQMQACGTVVPDPATFMLFGFGSMGAWLVRRKRQRRYRPTQGPAFEGLTYEVSFIDEERATISLNHVERNRPHKETICLER